ncbi:MAG: ADP-glyceromanno-heptose 6-epimerase [Muribaculaceae bacterium]
MNSTIIVTGASGFIGSNLLAALERSGHTSIVAVDSFGQGDKWRNVAKRCYCEFVEPDQLWNYIAAHSADIDVIVHLGAISSTTACDVDEVLRTNYRLSIDLFNYCQAHSIRFIYASSAATYGAGERGFVDSENFSYLCRLMPLNPYGWSKALVDKYIAAAGGFSTQSPQVAGLKFFNVYGPNEYHKQHQMSVIHTFVEQLSTYGQMRLFKSNDPRIADGEQQRDFVYVDDCVNVILWLIAHPQVNGIYNVGSGQANTFNTVARIVANAMNKPCHINYIDIPLAVAHQYQNFTCADIGKLRQAGYTTAMTSINLGINDYISNYLLKQDPFK